MYTYITRCNNTYALTDKPIYNDPPQDTMPLKGLALQGSVDFVRKLFQQKRKHLIKMNTMLQQINNHASR